MTADDEGMRERGCGAVRTNISSGRQLKAARVLAGHTQESFAAICGYHVRSCIYWEAQPGLPTTNLHTLKNIQDALRSCGVAGSEPGLTGRQVRQLPGLISVRARWLDIVTTDRNG